ncbi:carboxypeptidase-like regulatory domain-containing protein [Mucilaginibacter sp. UR6-11]|uniref:carboxypeptidase-like regulatory domain-containing protein n=1 Tax=Mucilaginibacter sp. UR6-11 TaxID=1435644 RepID=UPI001E33E24E|nr:carboxypeptidase-like regulatory domain-containing protein [Mucilaginibacter sp. UR6-11]MCC8424877.1 TonB-dependent receptor [Mucilaginibacter sp. UR6-11]
MKSKKLPIIIGLICSLLLLFAFIPKGDDPVEKLVAALQKWTDNNPQEKVYLHMDKPYYATGDTIWFKGYVTVGSRHQLSALSGALYVELITEQDSLIKTLKLPITTGMVVGDFPLGDELRAGSYRIRAYTRWMRNAGDEYFFDKTFTVGDPANGNIVTRADYQYKTLNNKQALTALLTYTDNDGRALAEKSVKYQIVINKEVIETKSTKTDALGNLSLTIPNNKNVNLSGAYIRTIIEGSNKESIMRDFPIKASLYQSDVQFFPESGGLVAGVSSRLAFKAVGVDGLGVAIKGKVVDEANNQIAEFEAAHAGMGSFLIRPEAGKSYSAQITFPDGSTKGIVLPKASDDGFVLSVYQPNKDSILVRIGASAKQLAAAPTLSFVGQTNGEVIVASPVKIARASTSIWLEKKLFPTGIAQFTIFNSDGEPLNERVAFIRSNDLMQLSVKSSKNTYKSKEAIKIELAAKDGNGQATLGGNFSVSVIDETRVPMDESGENTIFSHMLLTSDLKGYVEKPNYYFTNNNDEVNKALDNLMLTQGYRRFTWKEIINPTNSKPVFEAEGLGAKISGRVLTLGSKPLPGATVTMLSLRAKIAKSTTSDTDGKFSFDGVFLEDSIKFAIQARTAKNSDHTILVIDTLPRMRISKNKNMPDVTTNVSGTLKTYLENGRKLDDFYEKTGQLDKVQRLKEVRIKAIRAKRTSNIAPQGMYKLPDEESADRVITFGEDDVASYTTLGMALQGRLQGIAIEQGQYGSEFKELGARASGNSSISVYLNGVKVQGAGAVSEILDGGILPEDVAKILVVRTNAAMVNMLGGPSVMILTKLGVTRKQYNPSIVNVTPKGFNKMRDFYLPKYDKPGSEQIPDLRTTVYWNPRIKTDETGQTSFNFFNADGPGTYKVIVEGINAAGEFGRQVYKYTVQ